MPKKNKNLIEMYEPKTSRGQNLLEKLDRLESKRNIYIKEQNAVLKKKAREEAKRKIYPASPGKKFRSFIDSKIRFG